MTIQIAKPVEAIILKKVKDLKTREERLDFLRSMKKMGVALPKGYTKMPMRALFQVCVYAYTETILALYKKPKV